MKEIVQGQQMADAPPQRVIDHAIVEARVAPCDKSKRGAVIFDPVSREMVSYGHNSPAGTLACDGSSACRASCSKFCLHAEERAILQLPPAYSPQRTHIDVRVWSGCWQLELVHVKVVSGMLVAGGKPSCWQCSRLCYEYGVGVWLYESNYHWFSRSCAYGHTYLYTDREFMDRVSFDSESVTSGYEDRENCPFCNQVLDPVAKIHHSVAGTWRFYSPREFHATTASTCGVHGVPATP